MMGLRHKRRKQRLEPDFEELIRREEAMKTLSDWGDAEFGSAEPHNYVRVLSDTEWAEYQSKRFSDNDQI
jgi:hypothetical protein